MTSQREKFLQLKEKAGLHSPSVFELRSDLRIDVKIDACFLCNPYAHSLFKKSISGEDLFDYFKYYPPQNDKFSELLSKSTNIDPDRILVGNGAIQIIEILMREFKNKRKCVVTPTFSTYYEPPFHQNLYTFKTQKQEDFKIDANKLVNFCLINKIKVLIIVNPNNPTGILIDKKRLSKIIKVLSDVTIILDESFIDFCDTEQSLEREIDKYKNLILIKSLSKNFGVAGLRLGYAICQPEIKRNILHNYGLCWNMNGLAYRFLEIISDKSFREKYLETQKKYIKYRNDFLSKLKKINNLKVYESQANFFMVDCFDKTEDIFSFLLFEKGIYTRILNDKLDLAPSFLRIASNTKSENDKVLKALIELQNEYR